MRYESERRLFDLPLVSIAFGPDPDMNENTGLARGFVAIGDVSFGAISFGGLAFGVFSVGGASVGLVSVGGLSRAGLLKRFRVLRSRFGVGC